MRDISMHTLDIIGNAVDADASTIMLSIKEDAQQETLSIDINDNGKGIFPDWCSSISVAFSAKRKTRKVDFGLSQLRQNTEATNISLSSFSTLGSGTKLDATFFKQHIDRPPIGYLANMITICILTIPEVEFYFSIQKKLNIFKIEVLQVKETFSGIPPDDSFFRQFKD